MLFGGLPHLGNWRLRHCSRRLRAHNRSTAACEQQAQGNSYRLGEAQRHTILGKSFYTPAG